MPHRQPEEASDDPASLIVATSGSSAPQLGRAVLQALHRIGDVETHLILSEGARQTIKLEMNTDPSEIEALGDVVYSANDLAPSAPRARSSPWEWVVPCSMRTLAAIASGHASDLITRAADVSPQRAASLGAGP